MTYMHRSDGGVKGFCCAASLMIGLLFRADSRRATTGGSIGVTFPKYRYCKLDFDFALRAGEQFGLIAATQG
ncbi:MAG TPA: hypothetical protein VMU22_03465 [Rhizomicrobium sp.]|nr:hypothetical protein [Rhizomicrobium sp.]